MSQATIRAKQDDRTRALTVAECRSLIDTHSEGRLGYLSGRGPRFVVVSYALDQNKEIVLRVPEYNDIGQYAPGERVTLDVDAMTPAGDRQTVRVTGRAAVLTDPSVAALDGRGGESWPAGITTAIVAVPLEQVDGVVRAERPTTAKKPNGGCIGRLVQTDVRAAVG